MVATALARFEWTDVHSWPFNVDSGIAPKQPRNQYRALRSGIVHQTFSPQIEPFCILHTQLSAVDCRYGMEPD